MAIYKDVEPLEIVIYQGGNEDFDRGAKFILEKLDALPTADVVEVVRCKDCKHWNKTDTDIIVNIDYGKCTNSNSPYHNEEETTGGDYCSYGERKCDNGKQ